MKALKIGGRNLECPLKISQKISFAKRIAQVAFV